MPFVPPTTFFRENYTHARMRARDILPYMYNMYHIYARAYVYYY
jgi:hypothetical protein